MLPQLPPRKSSPTSSEIDDISASSDNDAVSREERVDTDYSEGRTDSVISESESQPDVVPICPAPVRQIIGVFSLLTGAAGMAMMVYGGIGLNKLDNPELDKDRALLGAGAAMMAAGFFSAMSTTLYLKPAAS